VIKNIILIPVNFSEEAENGTVYALQISKRIDADIVLLNVYFNSLVYAPDILEPFSGLLKINNEVETIEKKAEINLIALKEMLDKRVKNENLIINISYDLVQVYPINSILTYAEAFNVSLIIMGSPRKK